MIVLLTKLAILLALGFYIINGAECTIILTTGSNSTVQMYISNDLRKSVKVTGPDVQNISVTEGESLTLNFTGPGELIVTEDDVQILRITDLNGRCFDIIQTHSTANITKTFGRIALNQTVNDLSLVLSGCINGGHTFNLTESHATNDLQTIEVNHDNITVIQPFQQNTQSLSFVGTMDNIALKQVGTTQTQTFGVSGDGHQYITSLAKRGGLYSVTQINKE